MFRHGEVFDGVMKGRSNVESEAIVIKDGGIVRESMGVLMFGGRQGGRLREPE